MLYAVVKVLIIYLLLVGFTNAILIIVSPISSLDELDYEIREFVKYYRETIWWWLTTFLTSLIAITIGSEPGLLVDLALLSVFILPAMIYFYKGYPFSLSCEYRPRTPSGRTDPSHEIEQTATLEDGEYVIEMIIYSGTNVTELDIDLRLPSGVEYKTYSSIDNVEVITDPLRISGVSPPGNQPFVIEIILKETTGVHRGDNLLIAKDNNSGRQLLSVRLLP